MDRKTRRRLLLLDDMLDLALRTSCQFAFCDGPLPPIRRHRTCSRCACIHRAIRMGLVKENKEQYVRTRPNGTQCVVAAGYLEQFSAVDQRRIG